MSEKKISFKQELDNLREAGFTAEQVSAIWKLVARVAVTMTNHIMGVIEDDEDDDDLLNERDDTWARW